MFLPLINVNRALFYPLHLRSSVQALRSVVSLSVQGFAAQQFVILMVGMSPDLVLPAFRHFMMSLAVSP